MCSAQYLQTVGSGWLWGSLKVVYAWNGTNGARVQHVIDKIISSLQDAAKANRNCFVVVRCPTSQAMAEAFEQIVETTEFQWIPHLGLQAPSCVNMLEDAIAKASNEVVSVWLQFPEKTGSDAKPDFYQGMDMRAEHLTGSGNVRVVALIDLSTMQTMARQLPALWRTKSAFLAWPESETKKTSNRHGN